MNLENDKTASRSNHNLDILLVPFFFFVFLLPKRPVAAKNVPLSGL